MNIEELGAQAFDPIKEMRALQALLPKNHSLTEKDVRALVSWKSKDSMPTIVVSVVMSKQAPSS